MSTLTHTVTFLDTDGEFYINIYTEHDRNTGTIVARSSCTDEHHTYSELNEVTYTGKNLYDVLVSEIKRQEIEFDAHQLLEEAGYDKYELQYI